MEFLKAH